MEQIVKYETNSLTTFESGFDRVKSVLLNSLNSPNTRRVYDSALTDFLNYYASNGYQVLNRHIVQSYVQELKQNGVGVSSINLRLSAIKRFCKEAMLNGLLPDHLYHGITSVDGLKATGKKLGNWLTIEQVEQALSKPDITTVKGLRDRALLAIMFGAGLRRSEVCSLTVGQLQKREGRWVIVDIVGKGNKIRSVPIAGWVYGFIAPWLSVYPHKADDYLFVSINKGDHIDGTSLSGSALLVIVQNYLPGLGAHDLRRTFAKLARKGNAPIEQISKVLGHSSVQTTEIYLGTELDLQNSPSDAIQLNIST